MLLLLLLGGGGSGGDPGDPDFDSLVTPAGRIAVSVLENRTTSSAVEVRTVSSGAET